MVMVTITSLWSWTCLYRKTTQLNKNLQWRKRLYFTQYWQRFAYFCCCLVWCIPSCSMCTVYTWHTCTHKNIRSLPSLSTHRPSTNLLWFITWLIVTTHPVKASMMFLEVLPFYGKKNIKHILQPLVTASIKMVVSATHEQAWLNPIN